MTVQHNSLVATYGQTDITRYMREIALFPMLSKEEEFDLAVRLHENQDLEAAHTLVTSYLRYVVKISRDYRHYGLRQMDLIQEGTMGLMKAVKKFDPYKGFRLSTYAMWWIRAAMHEYILQSWSLVKVATTNAKRKLFFGLRKAKRTIDNLNAVEAQRIGEEMGVKTELVLEMDQRLTQPDSSLNRTAIEGGEEVQNLLADSRPDQENQLISTQTSQIQGDLLRQALSTLNERERFILARRKLTECVESLESLGNKLGISRERVRQIEKRALEKLRGVLEPHREVFG